MHIHTFRRLRPWVQLVAFVLFVGLLISVGRSGLIPGDLFFRVDPLAGLAGMLGARRIVLAMLVGATLALLAALVLGRAWCGWLCPLGTLLDWIPSRRTRQFEADPAPRLRGTKYFLLALVLVAALLGNLTLLVLDPITLLYRTAAVAAWPAANALLSAAERLLYQVPLLQGPIDAFETALRGTLLPVQQPLYPVGILIAALFVAIIALNAIRQRFWCRYLCPLGGLLGMVSRIAWLRRTVGEACVDCQRCARACPVGTIDPTRHFESDPAECTMCLDCVPTCSRGGQQFRGSWHLGLKGSEGVRLDLNPAAAQPYDLSRRQFIAATGTALAAVGLFAAEPAAARDDPYLVLPPGAQKPGFLSECIRCGICLKVCPTSGLQPSLGPTGWGGVWTPVLVSRLGHCDYSCNACGGVCPVGAIPPLDLETKRTVIIGHAYIDRNRCLPWADNRTCLVCEEMCPLPQKAIQLEDVTVTLTGGETVEVRRPYVLHDRCIGCGICENRCPLNGEAAIRVYAPTDLGSLPSAG